MPYTIRFLCLVFGLFPGLVAMVSATVPLLEVTVFDAGGKTVFRGPTSSNATFATQDLGPGNYVVQFNSRRAAVKNNQYLLVVSAGTKKVIAAAVPGETLVAGGAAVKISVGSGSKITGQVAKEAPVASADTSKVRVIDGKRYVWVRPELGSNRAGHWAAEGLPPVRNVIVLDPDEVRKKQDRGGEGSMLNGHRFERPRAF